MISYVEEPLRNVIIFKAEGTLHHEDYKTVVIPEVNKALEYCTKINIMWEMNKFHGWDARAAWDDLCLGIKINKSVAKTALVGDQKWESWMSSVLSPFAKGEIRYFKLEDEDSALAWLPAS